MNSDNAEMMWPRMIGRLALTGFDLVRGAKKEDTGKYSIRKTLLGLIPVFVVAIIALVIKADTFYDKAIILICAMQN